ncbi:MAG: hypothetical protein GTO02_13400, partial [Candidatus Dadabacteria bacterium]|nr:hypothetical protein [Candidatus Dadabacteria bacterium]
NELYLDGKLLGVTPEPVVGASIANFNGVDYIIIITNTSGFMADDKAYTIEKSLINEDPNNSNWNNLGSIDWGAIFNNQSVERDFCHFFDPTGTKAIATKYYFGVPAINNSTGNYVTTRITFTSPTSFT